MKPGHCHYTTQPGERTRMSENIIPIGTRNDLDDAIIELDKAVTLAEILHDYFSMSWEYHNSSNGKELLHEYEKAHTVFMCLLDYLYKTTGELEAITNKDDEATRQAREN